jgi:catechol 2,3-dioxygenase-like lactoylglutathione lyase family enzyme
MRVLVMKQGSLRTDHVVFPAFDVPATLHFYTEVLQFPLVSALSGDDWGGKPWVMMLFDVGDGRQVVLVGLNGAQPPPDDGLPADVRHYAFGVPDLRALGVWKRRLRTHAVKFVEEDHGEQQSIYFRDPNGVMLEITAPPTRSTSVVDPEAKHTVDQWLKRFA